jgi:alpha-L-fucosidase
MATSDVRFTQGKDGAIYAFIMAVPSSGETLKITSLGKKAGLLEKAISAVSLLGYSKKITWKQQDDALLIDYPSDAKFPFSVVFRVK